MAQNESPKKYIYTHFTCATDTGNVKVQTLKCPPSNLQTRLYLMQWRTSSYTKCWTIAD
jgi:hypothetical protein